MNAGLYTFNLMTNLSFQDGDDESNSPQKITTTTTTNESDNKTSDIPENTLIVDISDALSEKDRVKFTVHTRTSIIVIIKSIFIWIISLIEFELFHRATRKLIFWL